MTFSNIPQGQKTGKGGRNQEAALGVIAAYAAKPGALRDIVAMSCASDGHDNTDAAGGVADDHTAKKAQMLGQSSADALKGHASFDFFKKNGNVIKAKRNSFNVADIMLVIRE